MAALRAAARPAARLLGRAYGVGTGPGQRRDFGPSAVRGARRTVNGQEFLQDGGHQSSW
ncbi:hypothetical protein GCM10018953_47640 [Streptosporangium nondiastaticum]